mgnify:CR=1 FL=1
MAGKKKKAIEIADIIMQIRQLLRLRWSAAAICKQLKINGRTYYRYLQDIKGQDRSCYNEKLKEVIQTDMRQTIEAMQASIQRALAISQNATDDKVKLDAEKHIVETEARILNLVAYIPKLSQEVGPAEESQTTRELATV